VDERGYHFGLYRGDGSPKLAARALEAGGGERLAEVVELAAPRIHTRAPRTVVTGGAGFLGANIVDALAADGADVLVLDSLARPGVEENLSWLTARHRRSVAAEVADVRDPLVVNDVVRGASAVLHLAAQVAVTTSLLDPVTDFEVNARGTLNVLEAVRHRAPDAPILFASTNKVYGELLPWHALVREGQRWMPGEVRLRSGVTEDMPVALHSPYGCSKGAADQYVLDYARMFGVKAAVLRMSCLYGPRQFGTEDQGWVAHFLLSALSDRPITIFGDGCQVRDLLYVDDAVAAWRAALDRPRAVAGRAFNLGGGPANARSLREVIAAVPELTGHTPQVRHEDWRPGDQGWYVSDTSAFTAATGWTAATPVGDGLRRLAVWLAAATDAGPNREELRA
jgi:CDP-paratose 2-epimerase